MRAALEELAGKISEEEMRRLKYAVEGEYGGPTRWSVPFSAPRAYNA